MTFLLDKSGNPSTWCGRVRAVTQGRLPAGLPCCPDIVRTAKISPMAKSAAPPRRHRLEFRVTPEQDALIRQAADLEDTTVTAFVLDTVTVRAKKVVKQHQDLLLSDEAFKRFLGELDRPTRPVPELVELFRKHATALES